ncbi:MAG: hypothetical protein LBS17_04390 [Actinomycetes bacterium]|jgi:hypothetical protein|nr:hypothetical protein [Actinomycetes bacterium]
MISCAKNVTLQGSDTVAEDRDSTVTTDVVTVDPNGNVVVDQGPVDVTDQPGSVAGQPADGDAGDTGTTNGRSDQTPPDSSKSNSGTPAQVAPTEPAPAGQALEGVQTPPEHTLAYVELKGKTPYTTFRATVEPYGVRDRGGADGASQLVVYISSWKAQGENNGGIGDLKGRNALMLVQVPNNQKAQLKVGGTFDVQVSIVVSGSTGQLAITKVL